MMLVIYDYHDEEWLYFCRIVSIALSNRHEIERQTKLAALRFMRKDIESWNHNNLWGACS